MSTTSDNLELFLIIDLDDLIQLNVHDTLLEISNNFKKIDDKAEIYMSDKPIEGSWEKNKRIWNDNPDAGEYVGWVCVRGGEASSVWENQKQYLIGDKVVPTADNGHYYECITAGTSGLNEPAFPTTSGGIVKDNAWSVFWNGETTYDLNDLVVPTVGNGYYYKCTTAGISAIEEPIWPTDEGQTVVDGTAIWTCYKIVEWQEKGTSCLFKGFGVIAV